jgi:Rrf2 family transcriptional regulator, cysteine metabolism repressor
MKLSTKCRYGVRAMIELARHCDSGPVKRKDLSQVQDISKAYLENILITLRENKLIATTRGAKGGFVLQSPPSKITVLQIVNALEGSLAPVECLDVPAASGKAAACPARKVWKRLKDAQEKVLSEITLQNILDEDNVSNTSHYVI